MPDRQEAGKASVLTDWARLISLACLETDKQTEDKTQLPGPAVPAASKICSVLRRFHGESSDRKISAPHSRKSTYPVRAWPPATSQVPSWLRCFPFLLSKTVREFLLQGMWAMGVQLEARGARQVNLYPAQPWQCPRGATLHGLKNAPGLSPTCTWG